MLHFCPTEPIGQVESIPNVHFAEHTGCPTMSMVPVHTPLSHSLDVSLTVTQDAPNVRAAGPFASGPGEAASPAHAARISEQTRTMRTMGRTLPRGPRARV